MTPVLTHLELNGTMYQIQKRVIYVNSINYLREITKLKEEKDVLILAHYYVHGDVQDVADYVGDSYYLSQIALEAKQDTILFCGVNFMAESAKILSPSKTIITPAIEADCPMAHMITPYEIEQVRAQYDDLAVVCYINSTAQIKALSDVCVTSANAVKIVQNLEEKNIFFVPDKNLGRYVASKVPSKNFIFNHGFCYVHDDLCRHHIKQMLEQIPDAKILAHPECSFAILELADYIGSTSGILDYASKSSHDKFIICTEVGIFHQLIKDNPNKQFYVASDKQVCTNMKKITLDRVYDALVSLSPEVHVDAQVSQQASAALKKMHLLAK